MKILCVLAALAIAAGNSYSQGTGGLPARDVSIGYPSGLAVDGKGNLYFVDRDNSQVLRVSPDGLMTLVAGNGLKGLTGDGKSATSASLGDSMGRPMGVAVDAAGNVFVTDWGNSRIRMVTTAGIITTVLANQQILPVSHPSGVAVDTAGNLFIADTDNNRIRKLTPAGVFTTAAGAQVFGGGFYGDGGPAGSAAMSGPAAVMPDAAGDLYIADTGNNRVRKVNPAGVITTVAGGGPVNPVSPGDGGPATNACLWGPVGVAVDPAGNLYIADRLEQRVRKVTAAGVINTFAGNGQVQSGGVGAFSGDGGPASSASLNLPEGLAIDGAGNIYIADTENSRIRKVTPAGIISTVAGNGQRGRFPSSPGSAGIISTLVGTGKAGFAGDGGPAASASLSAPGALAVDRAGNLFIADTSNYRIRKVTPGGTITTVAGNGQAGFSGDGGPAAEASFDQPSAAAVDSNGNLFIADTENQRIRKVAPDGTISTVAGTDVFGWAGDGGPAAVATLLKPSSLAMDTSGNLFFTQSGSLVRRVSPDGVINRIAGSTQTGFTGDGGPALNASLADPEGVAVDSAGNVYIADTYNSRVRKVTTDGIINTIAGNKSYGLGTSGDGGPATSADLSRPSALAVGPTGILYFVDRGARRVREVAPGGMISTLAGTGTWDEPGDGGPAENAGLYEPSGIAVDSSGNVYIAEASGNRVRKVTAEVPLNLPKPVIQSVSNGASYQPGCAAATWIMIAGINLSTTTRSWAQSDFVAGKLPTQLDGVGVLINGKPAEP